MRRINSYFNALDLIEQKTEKTMLNKKEVGEILNITQPTVRKRYGDYFKNGYLSKIKLAELLN